MPVMLLQLLLEMKKPVQLVMPEIDLEMLRNAVQTLKLFLLLLISMLVRLVLLRLLVVRLLRLGLFLLVFMVQLILPGLLLLLLM